jgi:MFS family permease
VSHGLSIAEADTLAEGGATIEGAEAEPFSSAARSRRVPASSWVALGVLSLVNLFGYMDRMALAILVEPIKADFGASDQQMGLLIGMAFTIFYSVLGIPLARLADRTSRVRLLSICLFVWSAMTLLSGMARNFPQLFLARVGVGVGEAGCTPPAHSLISDYFPRELRAMAIALFQSGAAVGGALGLFVIGLLAQQLGWRASLQIIGIAGLPLSLLVVFMMREPARTLAGSDDKTESSREAIGALCRRPAFVHLVIGYSLGAICTAGVTQWTPAFLMRSFGIGLAEVGGWVGASSLIGAVLGLLAGGSMATWLAPRDPRWELWIPAFAHVACVPAFAAAFLSPVLLISIVFKTIGVFLAAIGAGVGLAAIQSFAEPHRRATAVAILLMMASLLGSGFGAYLIGLLSDLLEPTMGLDSLRYALLASCVLLAWSVVHFVISARHSTADRVN